MGRFNGHEADKENVAGTRTGMKENECGAPGMSTYLIETHLDT